MAIPEPPIVLVHGIKGSHLAQQYDDSFDVIWSAAQKGFETIEDLELDGKGQVEADPWDLIAVMRIEQLAYGELLGRLRKTFTAVPVYIFRYDWRLDLKEVAGHLDEFLQRVQRKTGRRTVRIVTHSMGGLILAAFLKLDPERNLGRIHRAVIAAPPFWGAVEAPHALVAGETVWLGFNSSERFRKVYRTFPSSYQLVPGYENAWAHPLPSADIWNVDHWQHRTRFGTREREPYEKKQKLMRKHLERAKAFHEADMINFNALAKEDRDKFLLLYGSGEKTRVKIKVRPYNQKKDIKYFFDFSAKSVYGDGDGTVPAKSATRYSRMKKIEVKLSDFSPWWPTFWDDKAKLAVAGFHGMFLGLDKVQGLVCDWFEGKNPKPHWANPIKQ